MNMMSDNALAQLHRRLANINKKRDEERKIPNLIKRITDALSYENIHSDAILRQCAADALPHLRKLL